ncbi:Uncharacterized protein Rs2_22250 [Raphanus sativus]|nr:Uncharacterized protein Rs2_22250 [Raphanus sativus]
MAASSLRLELETISNWGIGGAFILLFHKIVNPDPISMPWWSISGMVWRIREECVLSKDAYMLIYARERTPCFTSAFEELKILFEATPMNLSPKSVLETTTTYSEECVSDLS